MFSDVIQQKEKQIIPLCMNVYRQFETKASLLPYSAKFGNSGTSPFLDQKYIPFVACAHETAQIAARLAEEAREIEKYNDSLIRKPHAKDGKPKIKTKLMTPPSFEEEFHGKAFLKK